MIVLLMALPRNAGADPPAARAVAEAATTGRSFGAWRLTCAPGGKDCAIGTGIRAAGGTQVLALVRPAAGAVLRVTTPLPLFLPAGVTLTVGTAPPWSVAWRTCRDNSCTAEFDLTPELDAALRRERTATVALTLEEGLALRFPISLVGYTAGGRALSAP